MTDNVVKFPGQPMPHLVLEEAMVADLKTIVVLGYDADGDEWMMSSTEDGPDVLWLLERCKHRLMSFDAD